MKKIIFITLFSFLFILPINADYKLELVKINYDAKVNDNYNRNDEYVVLKNVSGKKLNLRKWKVMDNDKHKLVLPKIILKNKLKLKKVYWDHSWGLWNNDHDVLKVKIEKIN